MDKTVSISLETAQTCAELILALSVPLNAPDAAQTMDKLAAARDDLTRAVNQAAVKAE